VSVPVRQLAPREFVTCSDAMERQWGAEESLAYTRWLATSHYENFHVVSFLLPKHLHQDFYNVYAFCRWADDLGDEIGDQRRSLELLSWWREELDRMFAGRGASHPVFVALRQTVEARRLPVGPFRDLIAAFVMDQVVDRYRDWEEVFYYCRYSANPVGRMVLGLCGYQDEQMYRLSDFTCTALQLANFWQDVAVDWEKGRVYLPLSLLERHGSGVEDIALRRFTPGFAAAMKEAVEVARELFEKGLPLARMVDRRLSVDIDLFSRGGMKILDMIERQGYNVLERRPTIGKASRAGLLLASVARAAVRRQP
jgi:squalene synthase HpnC